MNVFTKKDWATFGLTVFAVVVGWFLAIGFSFPKLAEPINQQIVKQNETITVLQWELYNAGEAYANVANNFERVSIELEASQRLVAELNAQIFELKQPSLPADQTEANLEPAGCPNPDYFKALTVGYVPQLPTGHKSTAVSASIGCAVASFTFGDGSYVTGQIREDGLGLETCAYVDVDGKILTCSQFDIRTSGEIKVEARIHKKAGGFLGYICLAQDVKAYTANCD
jgi:hypothetical protein